MSMTDALADMLTRIRNGQQTKLLYISVPYSRMKAAILDVLKTEGFIADYSVSETRPNIRDIQVKLKYSASGQAAIQKIDRVSKPGKRIYSAIELLRPVFNGMGIYILSTSKGVISDRAALQMNIGGEVICKVF